MSGTVTPSRSALKRSYSPGNSPDPKRQQVHNHLSAKDDKDINKFLSGINMACALATTISSGYGGSLSGSHQGGLSNMGPGILPELATFCARYARVLGNFNTDLKDPDKCNARLKEFPDSRLDEFGTLFSNVLVDILNDPYGNLPQSQLESLPSKWEGVLRHHFFDIVSEGSIRDSDTSEVVLKSQEKATIESWTGTYIGKAHKALWERVVHFHSGAVENKYAKYFSIIQSSGMGKSRMVDHLSEERFVIPMCLRGKGTRGFPAPDIKVRDYLTEKSNADKALRRCTAFLGALFDKTAAWVAKNRTPNDTPATLAAKFRAFMTEGQTMDHPGPKRHEFYSEVVEIAKKYFISQETKKMEPSGVPTRPARDKTPPPAEKQPGQTQLSPKHYLPKRDSKLESHVEDVKGLQEGVSLEDKAHDLASLLAGGSNGDEPSVVLAFDESHTLSDYVEKGSSKEADDGSEGGAEDEGRDLTYFFCLRRALREIREASVFSVFLSTTGKLFQFTPTRAEDGSNRVQEGKLVLLPPYSDIGYDLIARKIKNGELKLEDVVKIQHMVMYGRPLFGGRYMSGDATIKRGIVDFAAQKLLNVTCEWKNLEKLEPAQALACLSVRLGLDFNPSAGSNKELEQIEKHLRVAIKVNENFDSVKSVAPSEPLLAEAARKIMLAKKFNPVKELQSEYRRPDVERGSRGETVLALSAIIASDLTAKPEQPFSVIDFLGNLFGKPVQGVVDDFREALPSVIHELSQEEFHKVKFSKAFERSWTHFNHFVKVSEHKIINHEYLWRLLARGAAVVCANNQRGIDLLIPFCYYDTLLCKYNVSAILIQVKNDQKYSGNPHTGLFDKMDPFAINLFGPIKVKAKGGKKAGTDSKQAGTDSKQAGTDSKQAGTDSKQAGTDSKQAGTDSKQTGTGSKEAATGSKQAATDSKEAATDSEQAARGKPKARRAGKADKGKQKESTQRDFSTEGPLPVIRIVAALASSTPVLRNFKYDDKNNVLPRFEDGTLKPTPIRNYTAYDFYCGGLTSAIWNPITRESETDWAQLLDASGSWDKMFKDRLLSSKDVEGLRRSQAPGAGTHAAHWQNWIEI